MATTSSPARIVRRYPTVDLAAINETIASIYLDMKAQQKRNQRHPKGASRCDNCGTSALNTKGDGCAAPAGMGRTLCYPCWRRREGLSA